MFEPRPFRSCEKLDHRPRRPCFRHSLMMAGGTEHQAIVDAFKVFGLGSLRPLLAGVHSPVQRVRMVSAFLLGKFDTPRTVETLLAAKLGDNPADVQFRIDQALEELLGYVPERDAAAATVYQSALDFMHGRNVLDSDLEGRLTSWRWQGDSLVGLRVDVPTATRFIALERAEMLVRYDAERESFRRLYYLCLLGSAKSAVGLDRPLDLSVVMDEPIEQTPLRDPEFVDILLGEALAADQIPAAVAATELLSQFGDKQLLRTSGGRFSNLLKALTYGDPRLQYASTICVMELGPDEPFVGSSQVAQSLSRLAISSGSAKALIGHVNEFEAQNMAGAVSRSGLGAVLAFDSQSLFEQATMDPSIELILVSPTLSRPELTELVQQLRQDWRTQKLPVGILTEPGLHTRLQRFADSDPMTLRFTWTVETGSVAGQVLQLFSLNASERVGVFERAQQADVAASWLEKVVSDDQLRKVIDLSPNQEYLIHGLYIPGLSPQFAEVLGRLGTRDAQLALLRVAGDLGQPLESRQRAVEAFGRAIQSAGVLLTRQEIERQYERYNASESESSESQQVLGQILDQLENRVRDK